MLLFALSNEAKSIYYVLFYNCNADGGRRPPGGWISSLARRRCATLCRTWNGKASTSTLKYLNIYRIGILNVFGYVAGPCIASRDRRQQIAVGRDKKGPSVILLNDRPECGVVGLRRKKTTLATLAGSSTSVLKK